MQVRKYTRPERPNEPGPQEQAMAANLGFRRGVSQGLAEKLGHFHGMTPDSSRVQQALHVCCAAAGRN